MTTCPTCQRPVDPLRAPVVGVRDGKVVSFCSRECAAGASAPVVAATEAAAAAAADAPKAKKRARTQPPRSPPKTPAGGVPTRETPADGVPKRMTPADGVPQRLTPAAGVPSGGVPSGSVPRLDSGPIIEIIREATSRAVREEPPIQVSETGRIDDYVDVDGPPPGKRMWLVVVLGVLVIGAVAAYALVYRHGDSNAAVVPRSPPAADEAPGSAAPTTPAPPVAPHVDPAAALSRARGVLGALLASTSPRIQRIAALALARTGDPAALARLTADLATEPSDIAKLDIDYGLARAQGTDPAVATAAKRGADALVAALSGANRRDVRDEAAARLVRLGDARGISTLAASLDVGEFRLAAAEKLAPLAEPRALKVLGEIRADATASADDRARAAIALAVAGAAPGAAPVPADVIASLHALLPDPRFAPMAASALAGLHDDAARPVLVKDLAIPSLRVDAARALRRLDPSLDPSQLLPSLLSALASGKDTDEVSAAEAILLLTGDGLK